MKDIDNQRSNSQWLQTTLDDLSTTSSPEEAQTEQARLKEVLDRYQNLMPVVKITEDKSPVVLKSHEYRDGVDQTTVPWLNQTSKALKQQDAPLDDLYTVQVMLDQHEVNIDL